MRDLHLPGRSPVLASTAMAATSHPLAVQVALDLLKRGGTAVDAAVGASLVLGFCEPQMTGIGGDAFALVRTSDGQMTGVNASGRAPAGMDVARLRAGGAVMPEGSAQSVTVPGAVDGFLTMLERWGKLGRDAVFAPAVHYAEAGVPVAPRVARDWAVDQANLLGPAWDAYLKDGRALAVGDIFRAPAQAETLRRIAREGRAGFYEGEVAEAMVATLRAAGGDHTLEDFAGNRPDVVDPISGACCGAVLHELPPNGQGATALLLAKILAQFDLEALDPRGAERAHLEVEATKLAYDARNRFIGDPETSAGYMNHMLADETAEKLAALIRPDRAAENPQALAEAAHKDTIYITVVDADRMAVSLIYSIFSSFGSGILCPKTGVLFQNRGEGFTLEPGHPNQAGPGKRPMHTIIPALLERPSGQIVPFGVMGGQYQAAGHVRFVSNLETYAMDIQEAMDAPRLFPAPEGLRIERGYGEPVRARLAELGHTLVTPDTPIGGSQAIAIDPSGVLIGGSDPRKDGCAMGY